MSDDEAIVNEIRSRLERDTRLSHPRQVAASAQDGTVTLRGSVRSLQQHRAVVEIARSVPGVDDVEDELKLDLRDHWQDDEIRGNAIQALMSNDGVPDERIEVGVDDGWLTLKGEVRHQSESNAAFEAVSRVPGVAGITNKIVVVTAGMDG